MSRSVFQWWTQLCAMFEVGGQYVGIALDRTQRTLRVRLPHSGCLVSRLVSSLFLLCLAESSYNQFSLTWFEPKPERLSMSPFANIIAILRRAATRLDGSTASFVQLVGGAKDNKWDRVESVLTHTD
ncbi:MAG: hypothetical protein FJ403_03945 [Verrucomicrobia bacterium]|nr:hypothetical protein [Verrucomicrobiota bacterium]